MNVMAKKHYPSDEERLVSRRSAVEGELVGLRSQLGAAQLDGDRDARETISQQIAAGEAELKAIGEAFKEAGRRQASAAPAERETWYGDRLEDLREMERRRLEAIERAEKAAHEVADALREALEIARVMEPSAVSLQTNLNLGGNLGGFPISEPAHATRLSVRLAAVLAGIQSPVMFGSLDISVWQHARSTAGEKWTEGERAIMGALIQTFASLAPKT